MTDKYYIVEYTEGLETWRSNTYNDRRLAEKIGKMKEKQNPGKMYRLELHKGQGSNPGKR